MLILALLAQTPRNPFVGPSSDLDSGRLCLAFLDHFQGKKRPYSEVAEICGKVGEPLEFDDLESAARRLGFQTRRIQVAPGRLSNLGASAILAFYDKPASRNYFVVYFGWDEKKRGFKLYDPPREVGPRDPLSLTSLLREDALVVSSDAIADEAQLWNGRAPYASRAGYWRVATVSLILVLAVFFWNLRFRARR
jgi:ABC-type bacteriocin/lantibiotic exporter with double-glycine peptidase domain